MKPLIVIEPCNHCKTYQIYDDSYNESIRSHALLSYRCPVCRSMSGPIEYTIDEEKQLIENGFRNTTDVVSLINEVASLTQTIRSIMATAHQLSEQTGQPNHELKKLANTAWCAIRDKRDGSSM